MMYHDDVRALALKINVYNANKKMPGPLDNVNADPDMENLWGASYFCSAVLYASKREEFHTLQMRDLESLKEKFIRATGYDIDISNIFDKGWLREVFTIVSVPSMIKTAADYAVKIQDLKNELPFFRSLYNDLPEREKKIKISELKKLSKKHGLLHTCTVKLESAKGIFWREKEDFAEVVDTDVANIVMEDIASFLFINEVAKAKQYKHIFIETSELTELYSKHASFFPSTPSFENLVENKVFLPTANGLGYNIDFRYSDLKFEPVADKYGGILWDKLLADESFENDEDRLFFWYSRLIHDQDRVEIKESLNRKAKKRFLDAAISMIEADKEVGNGFPEYMKLYLDKHHARLQELDFAFAIKNDREFFIESNDLFEIFERIGKLDRNFDDYMMFHQKTRRPLAHFIWHLVENDDPHQHKYINRLLEISMNKPYILWQTCFYIYYWRPEVIAFLTQQDSTAALSFSLMHQFGITSYLDKDRARILNDLLTQTFVLVAKQCTNPYLTPAKKGKIMFQCFRKVTERKFKNITGDVLGRKIEKQELMAISESIRIAFEEIKQPGEIHGPSGKYSLPFYTALLDELLEHTIAYSGFDVYENGTITLPFVKLDILIYLIKLASINLPNDEPPDNKAFIIKACKVFSETYLKAINITTISKRIFPGMDIGTALPSWMSKKPNESLLDFGFICLHLEQHYLLDDFFSGVKIEFTDVADDYDEFNRFTAYKLRTHLYMLLDAFNNIYNKSNSFGLSDYPVKSTLTKIEGKIAYYIKRYCTFDAPSRRFDIFNGMMERGYFFSEKEELLPIIGSILNRFSKENRQAIIEELIQTEQIVRTLKLLDYIVSEEERARLLNVVNSSTIPQMMQNLEYSDMQFVVEQLSMEPAFLEHAQEALTHAEARVAKFPNPYRDDQDHIFIFRTKLLLAYQKGALAEIDAIENITPRQFTAHKYSASDEKDFYRALIYLKNGDAEKAHKIFEKQLSYSTSERPVLALNRFASKLRWADTETNYKKQVKLYQGALDEWNAFESASKEKEHWQSIDKNVIYNKLHVFDALGENQKYDLLYAELEPAIQLRQDFLTVRVENLMKRNMPVQAERIVEDAKTFHSLENGKMPDFINTLMELTRPAETIEYLKEQYRRIFNNTPEQLIKIIPDNINTANELSMFLLNELVSSGNQMLRLINSISTINYEDKFTDLLLLSLNGRLMNYHWHAETSRAGYAHPEDEGNIGHTMDEKIPNPGEIDFGIFTPNKDRIATCEAFILGGKNTAEVQKHNLKIFNYDHARKLFFVIVYYKGKAEGFNKAWNSYQDVITDFIDFPEGHLVQNEFTLLTGVGENDSLKVGKTEHESGTNVYHIFMNINYKVVTKEKKVRETKK